MSRKKTDIKQEKIHLFSINIIRANLEASENFLEEPQKPKSFNFGTAHEIGYHLEEKKVRIRLFFTLDAVKSEGEPLDLKLEYGLEFHFVIENLEEFTQYTEEKVAQIDVALGTILLSIAYSTARGIVFERTRGTFFDGVILPVIDPLKLLMEQRKV